MDKKRITIGEKSYIVEIADTEDTRKEGLMKREFLAPDEGMLFVWPKEGTREMWMKDTKIALDQIGINSDDEVPYKLEDYQGHYHLYYDNDFHLWLKNTISTRHIIKWAKKAEEAKNDEDLYPRYCRRLGKIVFKELKAQDSREPQYVSTPN